MYFQLILMTVSVCTGTAMVPGTGTSTSLPVGLRRAPGWYQYQVAALLHTAALSSGFLLSYRYVDGTNLKLELTLASSPFKKNTLANNEKILAAFSTMPCQLATCQDNRRGD
jgi:hypothetical protein